MSKEKEDLIKTRIDELRSTFSAKYPNQNLIDIPEEQFRKYLMDQQYLHAKIHGLQEAYNLIKGNKNWKIDIIDELEKP